MRLGLKCPEDGSPLGPPRRFNLMFKTFMGPVEESCGHLPPSGTAPGSYVNFKNVQQCDAQGAHLALPRSAELPEPDLTGQFRVPDA